LIEDIVKELVEIFPSEYIHIGGDEVRFYQWDDCPDCQKFIKDNGLTGGPQLEQYFINRISNLLTKYNRKSMVWDEAVEGGLLSKSTLVCGWRNNGKGWQQAINGGYQSIVMPSRTFYLDKRQSPHERGHRSKMGVSLKNICDFSFEDPNVTAEQLKLIAGVEGAFWSEIYLSNIKSDRHFSDYIEYMLFPRIFGISEIAWSKERRSYEEILSVIRESFYHKLHAMGATFRLESPMVKVENGVLSASIEDGSTLYYKDIRSNKTHKYNNPLDAADTPFILFQSRLLTG
jgi:hexosaminidase